MSRGRPAIIPAMPDIVMHEIFNNLSYRYLCKAEVVCRRWQRLIYGRFRNQVHELVVDRMGCHDIDARQNIALERLTIRCPLDAADFLSGVMRRHHAWLRRLTCDVAFLANVGKLTLKKEARKKFFTGLESLWIVMLSCNDQLLGEFAAIEEQLFLDLHHVTLQLHVFGEAVPNAAQILRLLRQRSPQLTCGLELHAESSAQIVSQLRSMTSIHLTLLKVISVSLDMHPAKLCLGEVSLACQSQDISFDRLGFRDWYIVADPSVPITKRPIDTIRISSCVLADVDVFIEALRLTQIQRDLLPAKENTEPVVEGAKPPAMTLTPRDHFLRLLQPQTTKNSQNRSNVEDSPVEVPVPPAIRRLEVAGHCTFPNFSFLNRKAQEEFDYRVQSRVERIDVDVSQLYFID